MMRPVPRAALQEAGKALGTSESTIETTQNYNPSGSTGRKVKHNLYRYAELIGANASYVVSKALKLLSKRDDELKRWFGQHTSNINRE